MALRVVLLASVIVSTGFAQRSPQALSFGGSGDDSINAAAVDSAGNVYVVGTTLSFDLPVRSAFQSVNSGTQVIFSSDAGATWKPLATPFPSITPLQQLSIAADPANGQIVYVASGNSVCKSTNGGNRFPCVAIASASSQGPITSIAIDPRQPLTVYVSTSVNGGVFKSMDGGLSWANASQGLPAPFFIDSVTIDPFHPNVLYAWVGSGGYVSMNGAASWSPSSMPYPQGTSISGPGIGFSFDPVKPGIIYGPPYPNNNHGYVQKSSDGGVTWTQLPIPFSTCCVVPDPQLSGLLYAAAYPYPQSPPYANLEFFKSGDGGVTWTLIAFPAGQAGQIAVDPANPQILLSGQFRSTDGGISWHPMTASRQIQAAFAPETAGLVYATALITSDAFLAKFLPDGQTLVFSTYFGGSGNDTGQGIALDASGNIWITGSTSSYDLPVTPGTFQSVLQGSTNAFAAKFSNDGKLLAATYLGGSGSDAGLGIAISPQGNPWLIGSWTSANFPFTTPPPATPPSPPTGFVSELDPSLTRLLYSTNAAGTFDGNGKGIAIDSAGNITLVGTVYGSFAITPGAFHGGTADQYSPKAFVQKLAPSGQAIYSTYFGGTQGAPTLGGPEDEHDYGVAVAVDGEGDAYVAGYTSAVDFPVTPGAYQKSLAGGCPYPAFMIDTGLIGTIDQWYVDDVFVVKLSADGTSALFSTLLGGSCYDHPTSIAVDASGQVYVAGETDSANFPSVSNVQGPPPLAQFASFLSVFDAAGSALPLSTYLYAGSAPSVAASGRLIVVAGSTGPGAQTVTESGFTNPFPATATDGSLVLIDRPAPPAERHLPIRH